MARIGKADREHSGHYLTAVAVVTVVVAGLAWMSQNRTLAAAAAALGIYALHLLSIRFLLENQRRQRQVLDAQWEVLQRFLGDAEGGDAADGEELVPAMPVDRADPEIPATVVAEGAGEPRSDTAAHVPPVEPAAPVEPVVLGGLVPPAEALPEDDRSAVEVIPMPAASTVREEEELADDVDPIILHLGSEVEADGEPEFLPMDGPEDDVDPEGPGLVGIPLQRPRRPHGTASEVPVPRHFALGTVALVRDLLSPAEVARVLLEQRRQPGKKFGELAVQMGLLSESQREELLLAQQEGLFTDAEMREARRRLREFRENAAHSMASLD